MTLIVLKKTQLAQALNLTHESYTHLGDGRSTVFTGSVY